jgi:hypothetical protein
MENGRLAILLRLPAFHKSVSKIPKAGACVAEDIFRLRFELDTGRAASVCTADSKRQMFPDEMINGFIRFQPVRPRGLDRLEDLCPDHSGIHGGRQRTA